MKKEAENNGMPYIRLEAANHQFVKVQSGKLFIFDSFVMMGHGAPRLSTAQLRAMSCRATTHSKQKQ